jgi:hypothetical protein
MHLPTGFLPTVRSFWPLSLEWEGKHEKNGFQVESGAAYCKGISFCPYVMKRIWFILLPTLAISFGFLLATGDRS